MWEGNMDFWPFLTIFVSLVLILFFRRIDKRTLNFNKFKRYAEKLSEDFSHFVNEKKNDFSGSVSDLDEAIRRASQMIGKIQIADENLAERLVDVKSERGELEAIKLELEKLKKVKGEIRSEVKQLHENLPSLKKLSKRVKKVGIDIARNEKSLKNAFSMLTELEDRTKEKVETALKEMHDSIIEEAKGFFAPVMEEYRSTLELQKNAQEEELVRFRKDALSMTEGAVQRLEELSGSFDDLKEKLVTLETEGLSSVENRLSVIDGELSDVRHRIEQMEKETTRVFLRKAEEEYQRYISSIEKSEAIFKDDVFRMIEAKAKDLSSYVTRLEGRVENLLDDIKNETDKHAETLNLRIQSQQSEAEVLKKRIISEINEEANKGLLIIKPIVTEVNEKLLKYKREFSTIFAHIKSEFKSHKDQVDGVITSFVKELENRKSVLFETLEERIAETEGQLSAINSRLEEHVSTASQAVSTAFTEKLKEYESSIVALDGKIGDLKRIASTGQKMIEERIESVYLKYEPEINEKIQNLQNSTEEIFSRERGKILKRIEEIIQNTGTELSVREQQLNALLGSVDEAVERTEERFRAQEGVLLENVNEARIEARQELMKELENLRVLFREEKEKVLERHGREAKELEQRVEGIRGRVEEIQGVIDLRVEEALKAAQDDVAQMETNYLRVGEEMAASARERLSGVTGEIERIREVVKGLKEEVVGEINESLGQHRKTVDEVFAAYRNEIKEKERELFDYVKELADDVRAEAESSQQEARERLAEFSKEADMVRSKVEKRVDELEKRIIVFERETAVVKKAVQLKEQIELDIEKFTDVLRQLKADKKDIASLRKIIQNLKKDEGDISAKVRQLKSEKKLVSDIAKNAEHAVGLISVVEERIHTIESEKEMLVKIQEDMKKIMDQFSLFERTIEELRSREKDIHVSIETITKTEEFISNLEKRTEILKEGFREIKDIEEDIKKRLSIIDDKSRALTSNENRIEEVLERFKGMDALVTDIETRTKQLQSTREWLAKTESRLTNLAGDAERLVGELKELMEKQQAGGSSVEGGKPSGRGKLSREAESKVKTVLTLFDQKWTIPEICKVTKMSRGEVELILELNSR
jgi:DNA repair exonuclease SbcCD ATPase subunit